MTLFAKNYVSQAVQTMGVPKEQADLATELALETVVASFLTGVFIRLFGWDLFQIQSKQHYETKASGLAEVFKKQEEQGANPAGVARGRLRAQL